MTNENFERFVFSMWLLFVSRPSSAEPDDSGAYFIGDCGKIPEKIWTKPTPYSPAQKIQPDILLSGIKLCGTDSIAFVSDFNGPDKPPSFWET